MSCSIVDDRRSSKRGGPISERSWETMNHSEHAHTGTHALERWIQSAPTYAEAKVGIRRPRRQNSS